MTKDRCPECDAQLVPPGPYGRKRIYCSPECGDKYRRKLARVPKAAQRCSPTTADVDYTEEESEALREIERYRQRHGYRTLTVCEILRVLLAMGYARAK